MTKDKHHDVTGTLKRISEILSIVDLESWLAEGEEPGSPWDLISTLPSADKAIAVSHVRALGMADMMRGLVSVGVSASYLSVFAIARPVVEAASYGLWIWEPGISPEERVNRCLLEMKNDQLEQHNFCKALIDYDPSYADETTIKADAASSLQQLADIKKDIRNLKDSVSITLDTSRLKSMFMFAYANQTITDRQDDALFYREASAAIHQAPSHIAQHLLGQQTDQNGTMRVIHFIGPMVVSARFFCFAANYFAQCYGKAFPAQQIERISKELLDVVNLHAQEETFM